MLGTYRKILLFIIASMVMLPGFALAGSKHHHSYAPHTKGAHHSQFTYPKYQFLRFNENWSVLKNAPPSVWQSDPWNKIKYIPLGNGTSWLSLGGEMRFRTEYWRNFGFAAANDDTFNLWRILAHADMHFSPYLRGYIEFKSALSTRRTLPGGRRPIDVDTGALQQAFIDIKLPIGHNATLTLRPGRQELAFGKQRLVSPLPWGNTLRTWQGISAIYKDMLWKITSFATSFVPVRSYQFNITNNAPRFYGVYATRKLAAPFKGLDLYWLLLNNRAAVFNAGSGHEIRHTIGAHLWGGIGHTPANYDVEAAYQFGHLNPRTIQAYMFAGLINYKFKHVMLMPKLNLGFDYASGGSSATKLRTFNQLFPLGHLYLGYVDAIGRQNIIDLHTGVTITPWQKTTLGAQYHNFWRANTSDALYNVAGGILRAGSLGSARRVGSEIDTFVKKGVTRHFKYLVGYSHFFPGRFIKQSGSSQPINFAYLQLLYIV